MVSNKNWTRLSRKELLTLRLKDLKVSIAGSAVEPCIEKLHQELAATGIQFRPHYWVGDDWFAPDDIPGIAIPFFLLHPRLRRLERAMMCELDGGERAECMRILRHETGHVLDTAYKLSSRPSWRKIFGDPHKPYPVTYKPRPFSRNYVLHLDLWYAQSHPVEDFAETFAVWLRPKSAWRKRYAGWRALAKLEYVDRLMAEIGHKKPRVKNRERHDELSTLTMTLQEYYDKKRSHYGMDEESFYKRELVRLFTREEEFAHRVAASTFLKKHRKRIRETVSTWIGIHAYGVDQVLEEMIQCCDELKLKVGRNEKDLLHDTLVMVTVQIVNHLHLGHHRVAL